MGACSAWHRRIVPARANQDRHGRIFFARSLLHCDPYRPHLYFAPLFHTIVNIRTITVWAASSSLDDSGSDYVAVGAVVSVEKGTPLAQQPMPRWLAEHPLLRQGLDKLPTRADLDALDLFSDQSATQRSFEKRRIACL